MGNYIAHVGRLHPTAQCSAILFVRLHPFTHKYDVLIALEYVLNCLPFYFPSIIKRTDLSTLSCNTAASAAVAAAIAVTAVAAAAAAAAADAAAGALRIPNHR